MDNLTPEQQNLLTYSQGLVSFIDYVNRIQRCSHFQCSSLNEAITDGNRDNLLKRIELFAYQERNVLHDLLKNAHSQLGILIDRLEDFVENDKRRQNEEKEKQEE